MANQNRFTVTQRLMAARAALDALRLARHNLVDAGVNPRLLAHVRHALKAAEGALRNAERRVIAERRNQEV